MQTFSIAVNSGSRWWNWNTKPIFVLRNFEICLSESICTGVPSIITSPEVGRLSVPRICSSVVFQFHHLLPEFTAMENVCIPGYIARRDRTDVERQARELLEMLGMEHRTEHKPAELSGGEQQRVAIARALINSPAVLLADEPSGNLDTKNKEEIHKLFFTLRDTLGQTVVIVTHDEQLARMSDREIMMVDGWIRP